MKNSIACALLILFASVLPVHAAGKSQAVTLPLSDAQVNAFLVPTNETRIQACIAVGFAGTLPKSVKTQKAMVQYCECFTQEFWSQVPMSERRKMTILGSEQYDYYKFEGPRSITAHKICSKRAGD